MSKPDGFETEAETSVLSETEVTSEESVVEAEAPKAEEVAAEDDNKAE